uniref:Uncharacterized protein n=1 Tax=Anopheles atroparvus TaxID=41427 RepID=A0A182IQC3_ANOAO
MKGKRHRKMDRKRGPFKVALREALKTLKTKRVELKEIGEAAAKVRRSGDNVLLELTSAGSQGIGQLVESLQTELGGTATVTTLRQTSTVVIRDVSEEVDRMEMRDALEDQLQVQVGEKEIRLGAMIRALRKAYITVDNDVAVMVNGLKLHIWWSCRISVQQTERKCFRCHRQGHLAKNCKGPDRSALCFWCGSEEHKAAKIGAEIALTSDPYKTPQGNSNWIADKSGMAAIYVLGEDEFVALIKYVEALLTGRQRVIVAGDFNAHSIVWGSRSTDRRGALLEKTLLGAGLVLLNTGIEPTFERNGRSSIIDVTFASPGMVRGKTWMVSNIYCQSDHHPIVFDLEERPANGRPQQRRRQQQRARTSLLVSNHTTAETLTRAVTSACDETMPRHLPSAKPNKAFWWNADLEELSRRSTPTPPSLFRDITSVRISYWTPGETLLQKVKAEAGGAKQIDEVLRPEDVQEMHLNERTPNHLAVASQIHPKVCKTLTKDTTDGEYQCFSCDRL